MVGSNWVIYVLFGSVFSVPAQGFADKQSCEAFRAQIVKQFRPTRSACLVYEIKPPGAAEPPK